MSDFCPRERIIGIMAHKATAADDQIAFPQQGNRVGLLDHVLRSPQSSACCNVATAVESADPTGK